MIVNKQVLKKKKKKGVWKLQTYFNLFRFNTSSQYMASHIGLKPHIDYFLKIICVTRHMNILDLEFLGKPVF